MNIPWIKEIPWKPIMWGSFLKGNRSFYIIPTRDTYIYIYITGILNKYVSVNHHSLKGYVLVRTFHSFIFVWSLWSPRPPPNKYPFPWHSRKRQLFRLFTMAHRRPLGMEAAAKRRFPRHDHLKLKFPSSLGLQLPTKLMNMDNP